MKLLFDSLWRAMAYVFRPGIFLRILGVLLLSMVLVAAVGTWFWDAVDQVRRWLEIFPYTQQLLDWLEGSRASQVEPFLAPLAVAVAAMPVLVVLALLLVAQFLSPLLVRLVAGRRFSVLQVLQGRAWLMTAVWLVGSCSLAIVALVVSFPLWAVPPLWMVVPPLILGWLTQRVLPFSALVSHASTEERVLICKEHQLRLFLMGVLCSYLAMVPSLLWVYAGGARIATAFIYMAPLAMGVYVFLFAFSSLWFIHYCLAALRQHRTTAMDLHAHAPDPYKTNS